MDSPAALVMPATGLSILLTIALFACIIIFHEFGHFAVAKLTGMRIHEFSLGFGRPILLSFKRWGTQYSLRPVPIGGYVRIAGMEPDEDVPDGFDKKPIWSRLAVIVSGSGMNFVLAVILFWIIGLVFGKVVGETTRLAKVLPGSPAAAAGLAAGDRLVYAQPVPVVPFGPEIAPAEKPARTMNTDQLRALIADRPDMPVRLILERAGGYVAIRVTPASENERVPKAEAGGKVTLVPRTLGRIGVVFAMRTKPMGFWESVGSGFSEAYDITVTLLVGLEKTIIGQFPREVGGPLLIADTLTEAVKVGWRQFLFWCALISINVGVINLFPVPALDGSRMVFIIVEGIRRRPIDKRKEAIVHLIGFALLLLLLALVTYQDIIRLIDKHVG